MGQRYDWQAWCQKTDSAMASLICNFYLGVTAFTIVYADQSLRYILSVAGRVSSQQANKLSAYKQSCVSCVYGFDTVAIGSFHFLILVLDFCACAFFFSSIFW